MPENAEKVQGDSKFQKGQSGNPRGKARGTKNKVTLAAEALLKGDLENIFERLIEEALMGNMQAIKMVLDRVLPSRKDRPITLNLPALQNASDALQSMASISLAVSRGEISPNEGESLSRIIDSYVKAIEVHDYEKRLNSLEGKENR